MAVFAGFLAGGAAALAQAPITIVPLRALDFGSVLPGLVKPVDAATASGGVLEFRGDRGKQVRITLTLPTVILTTGGVFMPVQYSTSDALLSPTFDPSAGTRFDPNAIKLGCLDPATGSLFLFLGGLVQPRPTQRRGAYAGTVVAHVVYTGASCP
ncbi:MAG: hypothetical protein HYX65_02065 [Gemmatimonadetes bacterium]|nr:hypothetical protein [Gemmatimonadota bacterium]